MTFGQFLKRQRLALGYKTQVNLSKALGVSNSIIGHWEKDLFFPSENNLKKIESLLGIIFPSAIVRIKNRKVKKHIHPLLKAH